MRLDKFLSDKFASRTKAAEAINSGLVLVNGKRVSPSYEYSEDDEITFITPEERFVSNGGYKLSKALKDFNFSVSGDVLIDVGASNGGFTDCLFQHGAKKVYCIDVGESQLDGSLLNNNVVIMDNFNARNLAPGLFSEQIDGAVIDVSFISLTYLLQPVASVIKDGGYVIALIKPQFECESKSVGKRGIVKDAAVHRRVINKIYDFASEVGLGAVNLTNAPIVEGKNKEYLILLQRNATPKLDKNCLFKYVKL